MEELLGRQLICRSTQVLGHGITNDIHDIVFVDIDRFNGRKARKRLMKSCSSMKSWWPRNGPTS